MKGMEVSGSVEQEHIVAEKNLETGFLEVKAMLLYNLHRLQQFLLHTGMLLVWNHLLLNFGLLQIPTDSKMRGSVIFQKVQGHMWVKSLDIGKPAAVVFLTFWKS